MTNAQQDNATSPQEQPAREFIEWALATLKLRAHPQEDASVFTLEIPEDARRTFGGAEQIRFAYDADTARTTASESTIRSIAPGAPLFDWVVGRLRKTGTAVHAAPARQPVSIRELSTLLFAAYRIDRGHVHLAGCTLDDRPFLRLTYYSQTDEGAGLQHLFFHQNGEAVAARLRTSLNLDELAPYAGKPPRLTDHVVASWLRFAETQRSDCGVDPGAQLIAAAVVWCKYAEGKLRFVHGEHSLDLPFEGWAQWLATGELCPPPAVCPVTGRASYHLASTDDGRITVAEVIVCCEETGRRVLETELETCQVTGKRVVSSEMAVCPVAGTRLVRSAHLRCSMCQQQVSPATIQSGRCAACRNLARVSKDDPRMARILGEHAGLDRWRKWRMFETATVYVLAASSLLRRLLVVVDKDTLAVLHLATGNPVTAAWHPVPADQQGEYLS